MPKPPITRAVRLDLDTKVYSCFQCGEEYAHSSGYVFLVHIRGEELHFCDMNCCDAWEKSNPELKIQVPIADRRGAIAATRAKNK